MWDKFCTGKAKDTDLSKPMRLWGIVLKKGDVLYTYARDEEHAVERVFGSKPCYAVKHAIANVVPCSVTGIGDLTVS